MQSLKEYIAQQEAVAEQAKTNKANAIEKCRRIEDEMAEFNSNKDTKLDEMNLRVKNLKSQLKKNAGKLKDFERSVQTCELEIGMLMKKSSYPLVFLTLLHVEQMESDMETLEQDVQKVHETIADYNTKIKSITQEIEDIEHDLAEANAELENEKRILNAHNEEFNDLVAIHDRKSSEVVNYNLRIQKMTHENERYQKDTQNSEQAVYDLERQYEWIVDEKQ